MNTPKIWNCAFAMSIVLAASGIANAQNCFKKSVQPNGVTSIVGVACATDADATPVQKQGQDCNSCQADSAKRWTNSDGPAWFGFEKPVSFVFKSVEVNDMFKLLAEVSGRKIQLDDSVPNSSMALIIRSRPWTETMISMLKTKDRAIIRTKGGFFVFSSSLTDEVAYQRALKAGL